MVRVFKYKLGLILSLLMWVCSTFVSVAYAQSMIDQETLERVVSLSKKIELENLIASDKPSDIEFDTNSVRLVDDLEAWRKWLNKRFENNITEGQLPNIAEYRSAAIRLQSKQHQKFADIFEIYLQLKETGTDGIDADSLLLDLAEFQTDKDWRIANAAYYYQSLSYLFSLDYNPSLDAALTALSLIPKDQNRNTSEASYYANQLAGGAYSYLANIQMASKAIDIYIEQSKYLNLEFDGISILNNFAFMLQKWGEFETAKEVAGIYIRVATAKNSKAKISAYYRYAQALNGLGEYQEAIKAAKSGLALSPTGLWKTNLDTQLAIAYAGTGQSADALNILSSIEAQSELQPQYATRYAARIREAKALIAANAGKPMEVFRLMQANQVEIAQQYLSTSSSDTQKLMGTLSNAKELQRAKAKELTLQNTLKQERIAAQEEQARMMMAVIVLLSILGIGLAIFAVMQRGNAARALVLQLLADDGEKTKSDFLAVMSHELRTPLNGIIGLSELLSHTGPSDDVKLKNGIIYKSSLSLLELLTNVLDMTQIEGKKIELDPSPFSIHALIEHIENIWQPEASTKNIIFTAHVDKSVPIILMLDAERIHQCLENLVSNALKFTSSGRIHVHVSYAPDHKNKGKLTLVVADTGQGMSEDKSISVFNPFTQADNSMTREYGGAGLGLALTKNIAELMGGSISVNTAVNRGSEFTLCVNAPIADAISKRGVLRTPTIKENIFTASTHLKALKESFEDVSAATSVTAAPEPKPQMDTGVNQATLSGAAAQVLRGKTVLIVDDIGANRSMLKALLAPTGCIISTAENGQDALNTLAVNTVDVVLMDIRMPVMDGIEATHALRKGSGLNTDVAIVAITADDTALSKVKCLEAGVDTFLGKPVMAKDLLDAMSFALTQSQNREARNITLQSPYKKIA